MGLNAAAGGCCSSATGGPTVIRRSDRPRPWARGVIGVLLLASTLVAASPPAAAQIITPPRDVDGRDGAAAETPVNVIVVGLARGSRLRAEYDAAVAGSASAAAPAALVERLGAVAGVPLGEVTLRSGGDVSLEVDTAALRAALVERLRTLESVAGVWSIVPATPSLRPQPPEVLVRVRAGAQLAPAELEDLAPLVRHRVGDGRLILSVELGRLIEQVTARLSAADGVAYAQPAFQVGID